MDRYKKCGKVNIGLRYFLIVVAFVCCGFVSKSMKINAAAPVISIPDKVTFDSKGKAQDLIFSVSYKRPAIKELEYKVGEEGNVVKIENPTSSSAGDVSTEAGTTIIRYKIPADTLESSVRSDGTIHVWVKASNKKLFTSGGVTEVTKIVEYDKEKPKITKVDITHAEESEDYAGIGDKIKFIVHMNEMAYIKSYVYIRFSFSDMERTAQCAISPSGLVDDFTCEYEVKNGDVGRIYALNISNVKNIVDKYNNVMQGDEGKNGDLLVSNINQTVKIDGVKPRIDSIAANEGKEGAFGSGQKFLVQVRFNEAISVDKGYANNLTLNVKFGENGTVRQCSLSASENEKITYVCSTGNDQGILHFVSLSGGTGWHDLAGNKLDLSYTNKELGNVKADNRLPVIEDIGFSANSCSSYDGAKYCFNGKIINIRIKLSMAINYNENDAKENIKVFFDENAGTGIYSFSYSETSKTINASYAVSENDNGKLKVKYNGTLKGANGNDNKVSHEKSFDVYADNALPKIESITAIYKGEKVPLKDNADNTIYANPKGTVVISIHINKNVTNFNLTKAFVVSENFKAGEQLPWTEVANDRFSVVGFGVENNTILLTLDLLDNSEVVKFKICLLKDVFQDMANNTLNSDYVSDVIIVDTRVPEYETAVLYPEYKGFNYNGEWILISGDTIKFELKSDHADLEKYCIVENKDKECDIKDYKGLATYDKGTKSYGKYSYEFKNKVEGTNTFYIRVKDSAGNVTEKSASFKFRDMFSYSNGLNVSSKNHDITVDFSVFNNDALIKYIWVRKDEGVDFSKASTTSKQADYFTIKGLSNYHGDYMACIKDNQSNIICSEYVNFDNKIDKFEIEINPNTWTNGDINTTIKFDDVNSIKCISVGKGVSSLSCGQNENLNVVVYRTAEISNPFTKYIIRENDVYYFYIEDALGNNTLITKIVDQIDRNPIDIKVYNGNSDGYNSNLGVNEYKKDHKFKVTFDKDDISENNHSTYKYFFSKTSYSINNKDTFESYYLICAFNKQEVEASSYNKELTIATPSINGIYNLYIMAVDAAGNVSFEEIEGIKVDVVGPVITMYDSQNNVTEGGSSTHVSAFDYTIVVESKDSTLDLDIKYEWQDNKTNLPVYTKTYKCDASSYNVCTIPGSAIELGYDFDPKGKYSLVITAKDYSGNETKFVTNAYLIDTTPPSVNIDVDEDSWYTKGVVNFAVEEKNTGMLDRVAYCLNECKVGEEYNTAKFIALEVKNSTSVSYSVNVKLHEGDNWFYVYAIDKLGNYVYVSKNIKHDSKASEIIVEGIDEDSVLDLSNKENKVEFIVKDLDSGIKEYKLYYEKEAIGLGSGDSDKEIVKSVEITKNGNYTIEVLDNSGNKTILNFVVIGIDITPIKFDLITNVGNKFVNGSVDITVENLRKDYLPDDVKVEDKIQTIDYVVSDSKINDYGTVFIGECISVYDRAKAAKLVTTFTVSENKYYAVRVIDTAGNVSYRDIRIINIDNDSPFIDTNKNAQGKDKIYVNTVNEENLNVSVKDDGDKIYKYSNDIIKIYFESSSLMDKFTGFNNEDFLLNVCFDDGECNYESYSVKNVLSGNYLVSSESKVIEAPYNFSGFIRYYLEDAAGNVSGIYSFEVEYQNEVSGVEISLLDEGNSLVNSSKKYNKVFISLSGEEIENIISKGEVRYVLARSNMDLRSKFDNRTGSIADFLNEYKFKKVDSSMLMASIENVDSTYYAWVYIKDLLNNYKLLKIATLINLDTISPTFVEIGLATRKIDSTNYELSVSEFKEGYKLHVDLDNNGSFETVELIDNKYNFAVNGINSIGVKVEDSAGNYYIDEDFDLNNTAPIVEYYRGSSYTEINYEVYVDRAAKIRFSDSDGLSHINLYKNEELVTSCYVDDSSNDYNCIRGNGEVGFAVEGNKAYYYLDSNDYRVVAYDKLNNDTSVNVYYDPTAPVLSLYKKTDDSYIEQTTTKTYNSLKDLYVKVEDENFYYLTVKLENDNGNSTLSTYSYNTEIGKCLFDGNECEYGKSLVDILTKNTTAYNKLTITAYDRAGGSTSITINYDDLVPQIWIRDVGEIIVIGGLSYKIKENNSIDLELGVNDKLTLDKLLNSLLINVDGKSYNEVKGSDAFRAVAYLDEEVFDKNLLLDNIGNYVIKLDYVDNAGNVAQTKEIRVNVLDNTAPVLKVSDNDRDIVEFNQNVTINGIVATDNYGFEKSGKEMIKTKNVPLSEAACSAVIEGETVDCSTNVVKVSYDVYRFTKVGVYTFIYTVNDLSMNSNSIIQVIEVRDTVGPVMTSAMNNSQTSFSVYFSDRKNENVNINNISLNYPNSLDNGDVMEVTYDGLYALNNMGNKYKIENDEYLVSNINKVITYHFVNKGTYYLRFASVDYVGNVSMFEYEVKVVDNISPVFSGVVDRQVIEMGLEEEINVDDIIEKYSITAIDNYDSSVKIYYELKDSSEHNYEVVLKVSDSSLNNSMLTIYIDCKDWVPPTVGELRVDSETNKKDLDFVIVGGSDNSNNWWHEYSVNGGIWIRHGSDSKLQFSGGLSQVMNVCVRAVDAAGLISINSSCKDVLVDTKLPAVQGISDGSIANSEVEITISDDRLSSVEVWFNDELSSLTKDDMPYKFTKLGKYQIIANDELGNKTIVCFMINIDTFMNVVNDINASEYAISSIEFDKRMLVPVNIQYDISGYSTITSNLNGVSVNANDMAYILGVLPNTDATFVMHSINGVNAGNYANGITLISKGSNFKNDVNNEDCFVKFNDSYYAYVIIKSNAYSDLVAESEPVNNNKSDGRFITFVLIGIGALVVVLIGYQIVKFRKRVRAA